MHCEADRTVVWTTLIVTVVKGETLVFPSAQVV